MKAEEYKNTIFINMLIAMWIFIAIVATMVVGFIAGNKTKSKDPSICDKIEDSMLRVNKKSVTQLKN